MMSHPDAAATIPRKIKVVVLSTYLGGLEPWIERYQLLGPRRLGTFGVVYEGAGGIIGVVTGMGAINASVVTMALGADVRYDFSQTYWLVAGLGGIDPEDASLASAVWSHFVVDGDLVHEVDRRELPEEWATNRMVLNTVTPYAEVPTRAGTAFGVQEVYALNAALCDWAFRLTRDIPLMDTPQLATARAGYAESFPRAAEPPSVLQGDTLAASTYWHGAKLNDWANRWVELHTAGVGRMVITTMEDGGRAAAIELLASMGKADASRLLLLRTGCNYSRQAEDENVLASLGGDDGVCPFVAERECLENMMRVGGKVVDTLLADWNRWAHEVPA